jgi:hypothetical protein
MARIREKWRGYRILMRLLRRSRRWYCNTEVDLGQMGFLLGDKWNCLRIVSSDGLWYYSFEPLCSVNIGLLLLYYYYYYYYYYSYCCYMTLKKLFLQVNWGHNISNITDKRNQYSKGVRAIFFTSFVDFKFLTTRTTVSFLLRQVSYVVLQ